jgi:hypothetical protein
LSASSDDKMRMRWTAYAGVGLTSSNQTVMTNIFKVSTALAAGVVVKALAQRPNFYSAAVYLAQSSANLMVSLQNYMALGMINRRPV